MMVSDADLAATHTQLSVWDWQFRQLARATPEYCERSSFRILDQGNPLVTFRLQSWPTFVEAAKLAELRRASLGVSRLVRSIPARIFDNDPQRISEFYGIDSPLRAAHLMAEPNNLAGALSRGDLIDTVSGFKCIEFNMGANLGGWETGIVAAMHLQIPLIASFVREHGLAVGHTDTVQVLYRHVLEEVARHGIPHQGAVNIGFVSDARLELGRGPVFAAYIDGEYQAALRRFAPSLAGIAVRISYEDLRCRGGVFWEGIPIHALVEIDDTTIRTEVYQAFKTGRVLLYNGPNNFILASKRNIALLSEHRDSERFSAEERRLIHEYIPWTAQLLARHVDYQGERVFLPELLLAERERFVIKASLESGGKGVRLGKFLPAARWAEAVESALEAGDWLVQEHLECRPYLYQHGEAGCSPHNVIWGPFVFGDHYAGAVLRMQAMAIDGAVNLSISATQGIIFEV